MAKMIEVKTRVSCLTQRLRNVKQGRFEQLMAFAVHNIIIQKVQTYRFGAILKIYCFIQDNYLFRKL